MLDEQSVQLSRRLVANLDRADLQDFAGVLEPGKSFTKHRADFARSGLAIEMDRFAACRYRCVHDVLFPAVSETNRRRANQALDSKTRRRNRQRRSGRGNRTLS